MIEAKDCKCCKCGEPAVVFFPVVDVDIPSFPYCRKCLDEAKLNLLIEIYKIDAKKNRKPKKDSSKKKTKE